jgi:hypothetical protein
MVLVVMWQSAELVPVWLALWLRMLPGWFGIL